MKTCIYCNETKNTSEFPKHSHYKDNLDSRCRACVKSHSELRRALHKTAPPKPKLCECCHTEPIKWCLDHDHTTNKLRGWLCDPCNTGIGKLGDTIDGLEKAIIYLKKASST
jgi:hypothetical protein